MSVVHPSELEWDVGLKSLIGDREVGHQKSHSSGRLDLVVAGMVLVSKGPKIESKAAKWQKQAKIEKSVKRLILCDIYPDC